MHEDNQLQGLSMTSAADQTRQAQEAQQSPKIKHYFDAFMDVCGDTVFKASSFSLWIGIILFIFSLLVEAEVSAVLFWVSGVGLLLGMPVSITIAVALFDKVKKLLDEIKGLAEARAKRD